MDRGGRCSAGRGFVICRCSRGPGPFAGPSYGHALGADAGGGVGISPNRQQEAIGLIYLDLPNGTNSPITLDHIALTGRGLGTVAKVIHVQVETVSLYLSSYATYPPSWGRRGVACIVGHMLPIHGTVLPAHSEKQLYIAFKYLRPGAFRLNAVTCLPATPTEHSSTRWRIGRSRGGWRRMLP